MMLNRRILAVLMVIFSICAIALADAGPEPGYVRVGAPLVIQPQDDFSDYRFFLKSPGGLEEISVTKGKTTTISTEGRGGTMKYTTLIAVPKAGLSGYDTPISAEKLDALQEAINGKKIDGVIELASHTFDAYIKKKEKKKWKNPIYVLKTSADKKIEAVETTPSGKTKGEVESEEEEGNSHMAATIVAGSFLSLSFIFGGVWFARRKKGASVL
jgi:hypothetical protein